MGKGRVHICIFIYCVIWVGVEQLVNHLVNVLKNLNIINTVHSLLVVLLVIHYYHVIKEIKTESTECMNVHGGLAFLVEVKVLETLVEVAGAAGRSDVGVRVIRAETRDRRTVSLPHWSHVACL